MQEQINTFVKCSWRMFANSVYTKCDKWLHGRHAKMKRVPSKILYDKDV